jgi:hypothetical protein
VARAVWAAVALGPTWHTITRRARMSLTRLSPSTSSRPSARGARQGSAKSMPRPFTRFEPSLRPAEAGRVVLFPQAMDLHRRRLDRQGRPPPPAPAHRGAAGRPDCARHRSRTCGSSPYTCQGQAPNRVGMGHRGSRRGARRYHDRAPACERRHSHGGHTPRTGPKETVAKRHTWQAAMQVAAGRALHYAGQLVRRKGQRVDISLSSATTRPETSSRPAQARHAPRPRTAALPETTLSSCNSLAPT